MSDFETLPGSGVSARVPTNVLDQATDRGRPVDVGLAPLGPADSTADATESATTRVVVGRPSMFEARDWAVPESISERASTARPAGDLPTLVGWEGRVRAAVVATDPPREDGTVAMVGDGVNDAPALATADIGIALDHSALTSDSTDAVLTSEDLTAVPRVFDLTAATNRRVRQNLGWAFCYTAIALPLAVAGVSNPLFAAVAMATSSLLVVANSSRSVVE